ncbi:MAG TPA: hypothetical protein VFO53_08725 [Casimicrobiaceae bacterium]|nr:hypothetical protein [Casimicrobiaceae bacterium]
MAAASLSIAGCAALSGVDGGSAPRGTFRRREVVDAGVLVAGGRVLALGAPRRTDAGAEAEGSAEVDAALVVSPVAEAPGVAAEVAGAIAPGAAAADPGPRSPRTVAAGAAGTVSGDDGEFAEDDAGAASDVAPLLK